MNANEIVSAILNNNLNREELNMVIRAVNLKNRNLSAAAKFSFRPNQKVWFFSKSGTRINGVVTQLLQKNIKVLADNGVMWRVSPNLLKSV
jgi:hypothetical protein